MSYIESIAKNFAIDITKPRKYNYSHDLLEEFLQHHSDVVCKTLKILTKRLEQLEAILISNKSSKTCIIYAHGLGSNKLEALPMARFFKRFNFDICSFDFSGSGRSEGEYTTYGLREQDDICSVLTYLDCSKNYENYILWGRSMGSVAIILNQGVMFNKKVQCIILDSPFCSFEKVAIELASKRSLIPEFMLSILIEPLKAYFLSQHPVNPFEINICERMQNIETKTLLIYSKQDTVVSYQHSKILSKNCKRNPTEIQIQQDHNMHRSRSTLQKILFFIQDCVEENQKKNSKLSRAKSRGISIASKDEKIRQSRGSSIANLGSKITLTSNHSACLERDTNEKNRTIKTLSSVNDSAQQSKELKKNRGSTPIKLKTAIIESLTFVENNCRLVNLQNKQNIKPSLNLMRKNRFK